MRICLVVVCLFLSGIILSQENRFRMGLGLSGVASQVFGDQLGGYHKPGFSFSVTNTIKLSDSRKFRFELEYIQKGSRSVGNPSKGIPFYLLAAHYVQVPIFYLIDYKKGIIEIGGSLSKNVYLNERNQYGVIPNTKSPYIVEAGYLLGYQKGLNNFWAISVRAGGSISPFRPHESGVIKWYNWGQMHNYLQIQIHYSFY